MCESTIEPEEPYTQYMSLRSIAQGPPDDDWLWRLTFNERTAAARELRGQLFGQLDEDPARESLRGYDSPFWPLDVWVRLDAAPVTALEDQMLRSALGAGAKGSGRGQSKGNGKGRGRGPNAAGAQDPPR